ncbi:MAG: DEAD/DEAH box helicase [Clostridiales bacterium]|nr:DEAD/DEAH box helicase [Clostridiales bacterium]
MFTLETIRKEANEASFLKGKSYYRNNRVKKFTVHKKGNDKYEIRAVVRGSDHYNTALTLDVAENRIVEWNCTCPFHFGGICKHLVAVGIHYYYNRIEEAKEAPDESLYESNSTAVVSSENETVQITETVSEISVPTEINGLTKAKGPNEVSGLTEAKEPTEVKGLTEIKGITEINGLTEISKLMDSRVKASILNDLGLGSLMHHDLYSSRERIVFIFDKFNLDSSSQAGNSTRHMQAARHRKVSLKIVKADLDTVTPEKLDKAQGVRIDRKNIADIPGNQAFLLEYIASNGVYMNGFYFIGQLNIDTVFAISAGLEGIFHGSPPRRLEFTQEQYRPEIRLCSESNGSVSIAFAEEPVIIPGKYSTFVLKDDRLMKLHERIPYSFIESIGKKPMVGQGMKGILVKSVLPLIKEAVEIKGLEIFKEKTVVNEDIQPEVNIYVKYSKDNDEIYILPEISYGDYLSVNPFNPDEVDDFANFFYRAPVMPTIQSVEKEDFLVRFKRDIFKEHSVYSLFDKSGYYKADEYGRLPIKGDEAFYCLFAEIIPGLPEDWKVFYDKEIEKIKLKREEVSFDFDFSADTDSGLLEFDLDFHCGNLKIDVEQLNDYIRQNKKLLNIDGSFVEVTNREELQRLLSLLERFKGKGKRKKYSGKLYNASELDSLIENGRNHSYKSNEDFKCLMHEMKNGRLVEDVEIPDCFSKVLRNYQKDGVQWIHFLRKYGFGGILADDMGLGKTFQALTVLSMKPSSGQPSLIVCPKTLIHNWYNEIQKFVPGMKTVIACGGSVERLRRIRSASGFDLVITSYPLLQKDIAVYSEMEFEYCIIDEAQYIKNASTRTAKCVKAVKSKFRLALTGTPLENSVMDLWSVFDFVMPGFLGSEAAFKMRYANDLHREGNTVLTGLNRKIKPFLLRRTKKEMLKDLPPKIEQVGLSELTAIQLALYTKMLEKIRGDLYDTVNVKGFENSRIEILAGLMRLRQICNHPGLLSEKFLGLKNASGKMDLFEELIDESLDGGHRVLVFSQFVKMLEILKGYLNKNHHLHSVAIRAMLIPYSAWYGGEHEPQPKK